MSRATVRLVAAVDALFVTAGPARSRDCGDLARKPSLRGRAVNHPPLRTVHDFRKASGLDAYPSPAAHDVNIAVSRGQAGALRVEAIDLLGRQAAQLANRRGAAGRSELTWSTDGLPSGLHLIRLFDGTRAVSMPVVLAG